MSVSYTHLAVYKRQTDGSLDLVGLDEMIRNFQQYLGLSWEEFESYYDILNMPRYIGLK